MTLGVVARVRRRARLVQAAWTVAKVAFGFLLVVVALYAAARYR